MSKVRPPSPSLPPLARPYTIHSSTARRHPLSNHYSLSTHTHWFVGRRKHRLFVCVRVRATVIFGQGQAQEGQGLRGTSCATQARRGRDHQYRTSLLQVVA